MLCIPALQLFLNLSAERIFTDAKRSAPSSVKLCMDRSVRLCSWVLEGRAVCEILEVGYDLGTNKPFLALVILDLGNLLGKYGIEVAIFNSAGNKKARLCSATDDQVE